MHAHPRIGKIASFIVESLVKDAGYRHGKPENYDWEFAVDMVMFMEFLEAIQPKVVEKHGIGAEGPAWIKLMYRLKVRPDVKDGKQAEFLLYNSFPIDLIQRIGVIDDDRKLIADNIVRGTVLENKVQVMRDWYY